MSSGEKSSLSSSAQDNASAGVAGVGSGKSWSAEFKKKRQLYEDEDRPGRVMRLGDLVFSQGSAPIEPGLDFSRTKHKNSDNSRQDDSPKLSSSSSSLPWSPVSHQDEDVSLQRSTANSSARVAMDGQRFIDEDDDGLGPLGINPARRSPSNQRVGEETGQKEQTMYFSETRSPLLQSQSEDSEREDAGLSHQIEFLTTKNQQLQKQLEDREMERDRMREQLETQRNDRGLRFIYSPPGLPSRVLDGRKVLRESVTSVTSPEMPSRPRTPRSRSPHGVASPLPTHPQLSPATSSSFAPHSPRACFPPLQSSKDYETGSSKRHNIEDFVVVPPRSEGSSSERYLQQQVEELKRDSMELERRLHELSEDKRRMEAELKGQHEAFVKMQAREQDLSKDIEVLRDENSHHTGAITRLQDKTVGLKSENESLHEDLMTIKDKLNKTEKCYKEVEHENLSLEAEIEQLVSDKKKLFEERQELQVAVEDALKTKENYRSTIKQLREQNQSLQPGVHVTKLEKKKVIVPATKEQKTLGEVMNLREEKVQLQGRLLSAQQEIDSLEAHLKVHEEKYIPSTNLHEEHLARFRAQLSLVCADLVSVQNTIMYFSSQQQALVHDSFLMLVDKCHEHLSRVEKEKGTLSEGLRLAESGLSKMADEYELLKETNAKLHTQKAAMQEEVTALKDEISTLHDQKRMQSVQLSLNESISRQNDEKISEMELARAKLETKYSTSERNWKREYGRLEMEWESRVAEIRQNCELLLQEKEALMTEKAQLEVRLAEVVLDNKKLTIAKDGLETQIKNLEESMVVVTLKVDENERAVCKARDDIATLLTQKVCLSAQIRYDRQEFEDELNRRGKNGEAELSKILAENENVRELADAVKRENATLSKKLEAVSGKEKHIGALESRISVLVASHDLLQAEMDALVDKHSSVLKEFQLLEELEHSRRLDNEKLKMTLSTEIKLLKSKLSIVEKERGRLEVHLLEVSKDQPKSSAFHTVSPNTKQVEQLKKHIAALQNESKQQRKLTLEANGTRNSQVAELQSHLSKLEAENNHLKESASLKSSGSSHPSLDEETAVNLRKKVTEMTRKTFFLESDKQHLTEKIKSLTANLKSARETKDHAATEQILKLQAENKLLQERVHKLEGNLTKKLMAADSKIIETVKENDKLKSKLQKIQLALGSEKKKSSGLENLLCLLKNEYEMLQELKSSLSISSKELEKLELGHHRIEDLQQEIQLTLTSFRKPDEAVTLPTETNQLSVFKSLPEGYAPPNLQGQKGLLQKSEPRQDGGVGVSGGGNSSNPDLHKKMCEINSATVAFSESFQRHKCALKHKDKEVASIQERLLALEGKFRSESERSHVLKDILDNIHGLDLNGENLKETMQQHIEKLQDQVIIRDSVLADIEAQMKVDFEMHHKKFSSMKSQVLELREENSTVTDVLRSKDQFIQQMEDRCLNLESDLFKVSKELERVCHDQNEMLRIGVPENMKLKGVTSLADVVQIQGEEINQLKKVLRDFTCEVSQAQSQIESVQRDKSILQSKAIEMERMHMQMKEHLGSDVNYLRQLNLQLIEQQMKTEKATEILKEVKDSQNVFKKQRDLIKTEAELDAAKIIILEQNHKMSEMECQLTSQAVNIKILHAEKEHSVMLNHHTPELPNQMTGIHMRPRSAESARTPKYICKSSDFKSRMGSSSRSVHSEFSIFLPSQNSAHGQAGGYVLNLEEQPEAESAQQALRLGPTVVTDDEYVAVANQVVEKTSSTAKHQRWQKLKRGHRRTASTGSNISKDKGALKPQMASNPVTSLPPSSSTTLPATINTTTTTTTTATTTTNKAATLIQQQQQQQQQKQQQHPGKSLAGNYFQKDLFKDPHRPGSAGSSRQELLHMRQENRIETPPPHAINEYSRAARNKDRSSQEDGPAKLKDAKEMLEPPPPLPPPPAKKKDAMATVSGRRGGGEEGGAAQDNGGTSSINSNKITGGKPKGRFDLSRKKQANKSTDSNETTSSEGNGFSSKGSSQSDSSGPRQDLKRNAELSGRRGGGGGNDGTLLPSFRSKAEAAMTDLSRTESMSSTCSTLSIYGNAPSRNHSFTYDGGESSPYSHESLEIGDSVENLQSLGKLGPYIKPIMLENNYHCTTSSSDEENYRKNRRKKSSTTGDNTPRHREMTSYHSNSSYDSDTLQQDGYRNGGSESRKHVGIPLHKNESISVSDMDRDTTDIEMEQKAADLQECFNYASTRRVRYSSTGSVKICYSESSNTSLEDITKA